MSTLKRTLSILNAFPFNLSSEDKTLLFLSSLISYLKEPYYSS